MPIKERVLLCIHGESSRIVGITLFEALDDISEDMMDAPS